MNQVQDQDAEIAFHAELASREGPIRPTLKSKVSEYKAAAHWSIHARHGFLNEIHKTKAKTILDFGCGSGEMVTRLALMGYDVTGIDLSPDMTEMAKERIIVDNVTDRARVVTGDAMTHCFDEKFDLITAQLIMHHLDVKMAMDGLVRHLKPNGTIVFWEPVAFSRPLQWVRDHCGVKKEVSVNERQLAKSDLNLMGAYFKDVTVRHYYIFTRLQCLLPDKYKNELSGVTMFLKKVDHLILKLPGATHFAASVVMICRAPR